MAGTRRHASYFELNKGSNSLIGHLKSLSEGDEQDEKKKVDDVH